ncbi:YnjH family protein [Vibrio sp. S4M6]|uniref:DUF1496 domain-containing protein n=1 Tax=Vibrio sinus TaxID=2946865 RepID=UPI002029B7B3|nr:DUF1496 domain-containing protein [Vibrio sinus]MCL9781737.1 YnjH family protein [Vibrio sinus]
MKISIIMISGILAASLPNVSFARPDVPLSGNGICFYKSQVYSPGSVIEVSGKSLICSEIRNSHLSSKSNYSANLAGSYSGKLSNHSVLTHYGWREKGWREKV